jgi:polyhydroxyalkanoate synthesis regulator protein
MGMIGMEPIKAMEETVRRNAELFQDAMKMFMPFGVPGSASAPRADAPKATAAAEPAKDDLSDLKDQIAAMQRKLEQLGKT